MKLEQKYQSLLHEAQLRHIDNIENIHLCFQMLSLASHIDKVCAEQLAPYGLSEAKFILLFLMDASPDGIAPKTLAEKAGVTRATITGLLDGLEREQLIKRKTSELDRRGLTVQLTPKGQQIAKKVFAHHSQWIASIFNGISVEERKQFSFLLNKVNIHFENL